jgi:hypothetical protein
VKYRGCLVAAVLVAAAALSGCTWTSGTPYFPQPTGAELEAAYGDMADANWEFSGLDGRMPRPEVAMVRPLAPDEWAPTVAECMITAGYPTYAASGGGLTHTIDPAAPADAEALAMFVCQSQYPYEATRFAVVGEAQHRYLYDYYTRWLIPCLGWRGYDVGPVPDETEYLDAGGNWTPYTTLWEDLDQPDDARELQDACRPEPEGFRG